MTKKKKRRYSAAALVLGLAAAMMLSPEAAEAQEIAETANLPYKYTGNTVSLKFHRPRCPFSRVMSASKKIRFHFRCQAVAAGYVPCRYCLPPVWTTVRCVIKSESLNRAPLGTSKGASVCGITDSEGQLTKSF